MQTRLIRILSIFAIAVGLNGCATAIQGKSPEEAGRQALTQLIEEPAYNFEGSGRVTGVHLDDKKTGEETSSKTSSVDDIIKAFSVEISGAWDLPKKRMEMIPVVRFDQRNLQGMVRFPLIIDANPKPRVLVDPSALSWFMEGLKPYEGKFVQLPNELITTMGDPFDPAKREQIKKIYSGIDPQSFSFQPLNELDKQWGASSKVRVALNQKQLSTLFCRVIAAQLQLGQPVGDEGDEASDNCLGMDDLFSQEGLIGEVYLDLGLDSQGRTRSLQAKVAMKQPDEEKDMTMVFNMHMFNFGNPKFSLNPTANQIAQLDTDMSFAELMNGQRYVKGDDTEEVAPAIRPHKKPVTKHKKPAKTRR